MPPLTPVGPVAAGRHRSALQARAAGSTGQALPHVARVVCRSSSLLARPPSQRGRHLPTHPPTQLFHPPSHPARHAPIPPHTCADRAASRGCSLRLLSAVWPDSNARAIPTAQGLGLIPQLLWVARFSAVRHLTRRTPRRTPSRAAPRTAHPQRTRGVSCTIRGCLHQPRRSRADLNPTPTASPLMRSPMAHARWHMAVAAWMSYVSPHIHPPPKHLPAVVQLSPNPHP